MKMNLARKIALFVGVLILSISLTLSIISVKLSSDEIIKGSKDNMLIYSEETAKRIDTIISSNLGSLSEIANRARTKTMDLKVQKESLKPDVARLGYLDMGVVNPDGTTNYILGGTVANLGDRDYVKKAFQGQPNVSNPIVSKVTGTVVLMEATPIYEGADNKGKVIGVLIGRRDGAALNKITDGMGIGERGYGFIIGEDSSFYAHPNKDLLMNQKKSFDDIDTNGEYKDFGVSLKKLGTKNKGIINYSFQGSKYITALHPINGTTWTLAITNYKSDILSGVNKLIKILIIFSLVVILIGVFAAIKLGGFIASPVIKVSEMIRELSKGHLESRLNLKYNDEIGEMANLLDGFAEDLHGNIVSAMQYIAKGDLSRDLIPKDEQDEITPALNKITLSLRGLVKEASILTEAAVNGDLSIRGKALEFEGGYKEVITGINETLDAVIKPLDFASDYISKLAKGEEIQEAQNNFSGYYRVLISNINEVRNSLYELLNQSAKLSEAGERGDLTVRGDLSNLKGGYAKIINGINQTLDVIIDPIKEAEKVLSKMAVNDYTMKMSDNYKGTLKELGDSINDVQTRLLAVQNVFVMMSKGDIRSLDNYKKIGRRSEEDKLIPATILMMQSVNDLIEESKILSEAALEGNLSVRGNENKFEGGYKEIIEGMNKTMKAVEKPIKETSDVLQELSTGDLRVSVKGMYKGEYKKIKDALNDAVSSFGGTLKNINEAADQVSTGANQVADGSQELSQGTTEQASAIEELTASIVEVASKTKQNSVLANRAADISTDVKENAKLGNIQMKNMLSSMEEINESSSNIGKIIKVIDDIAFQTNILALNAAVEAARAGQYGKGFAVVADEVRNLAARSASAAKETTELIESSVIKTENGTKIANDTARSLAEIEKGIEKSANIIKEIVSSSNEQATAISEINRGIEQVSSVVQTNSATSEESAASSEELSGQAIMLKNLVEQFKL